MSEKQARVDNRSIWIMAMMHSKYNARNETWLAIYAISQNRGNWDTKRRGTGMNGCAPISYS